jgi:4-aminobutyrate aminotransferase/(S)-3-amino-2-methylpropionate transaminase
MDQRAESLDFAAVSETQPPSLVTAVPGPRSRALAARLAAVESRNVTALAPEPPIFWERAAGANVWDADGNRYVDLGAGFGVANVGHAHPRVVEALAAQERSLLHAMGDVHPAAAKVALLEALAARFPGGGPTRAVLGSSGSDAVEVALKTALLATGRAGVVAFEGAYHGVTLGALDATWRRDFREPFADRLAGRTAFAHFGDAADVTRAARACPAPVGAVIVEPVQGRGGERVPPPGFLRALRERCDAEGWLLIADEVYTGCGRTGRFFACEHEGVVPDLLCVGKGLGGGMPISACVGRAGVMDAWPVSHGEALHTQTFLGHPPGCAAALAALAVIDEEKLAARAAELGAVALAFLRDATRGNARVVECRGLGLLIGIECDAPASALSACAEALRRGVIAIPSGDDGRVIAVTPPLVIGRDALLAALAALVACIR